MRSGPWYFLSSHYHQETRQPSSLSGQRYASPSWTLFDPRCTACPIKHLLAILWKAIAWHVTTFLAPHRLPRHPQADWHHLPGSPASACQVLAPSPVLRPWARWKESLLQQPVRKPARVRQQGTLWLVPKVLGPAGPAAVVDEKAVRALNVGIRSPRKETSWTPAPRLLVHHNGNPGRNSVKYRITLSPSHPPHLCDFYLCDLWLVWHTLPGLSYPDTLISAKARKHGAGHPAAYITTPQRKNSLRNSNFILNQCHTTLVFSVTNKDLLKLSNLTFVDEVSFQMLSFFVVPHIFLVQLFEVLAYWADIAWTRSSVDFNQHEDIKQNMGSVISEIKTFWKKYSNTLRFYAMSFFSSLNKIQAVHQSSFASQIYRYDKKQARKLNRCDSRNYQWLAHLLTHWQG